MKEDFEETYERVCAISYSLINKVEKWLEEKSEIWGREIGFVITPDLVAVSFLFFENFVEMPIFLTNDEETKSSVKEKLKELRKIKNNTIDELSRIIFHSEKGYEFYEKWNNDDAFHESFKEIKEEFHEFILNFYQTAREVQKSETSLLMIGGLLTMVVGSMAFSAPELRDETQDIVLKVKDSWVELFT